MPRLYAKAQRELAEERDRQMEQGISDLKALLASKKDGNFDSVKSQVMSRLDEMIAASDRMLQKFQVPDDGWDFGREKSYPVFAEGATLRLRPFADGDERLYYEIRESYKIFEKNVPDAEMIAVYWSETQRGSAFYCVVQRVSDSEKLGYIALKDTSKDVWEVAIELLPAYCGRGYGTEAIPLFLNRVRAITEKDQYQFVVEVDNIPCQRCMEKIRARLTGVVNLVFDDPERAERFEEDNLDLISNRIEELALELGIEPRKLLSHVLDYRLCLWD